MKKIAPESRGVEKARIKLQKKFAEVDNRIHADALNKMRDVIRHWLERHKEERMSLKDRGIKLFDENKHPESTKSRHVTELMNKLKTASQHKFTV